MTTTADFSPSAPSPGLTSPTPTASVAKPATAARAWSSRQLVLAAAVIVLGFVLASIPARNSDIWLHLGTGKALVNGEYRFGVDPFAFTTEGSYWVNHSWLYDLICYSLYTALGDKALVIAKAVLMAGVALLLLLRSRVSTDLGVPALCTALALIAISPYVLLHPFCVSYFLLAMSLWLLDRAGRQAPRFLAYAPLLIVFVLWVNLDAWFLLGPLVVGLYLLASWLQERGQPGTAPRLVVLAKVLVAGLTVCLFNPHHVHVFQVPPPLSFAAAATAFGEDPLARPLLSSSFPADYYTGAVATVAGIAYGSLVVLSLLALVLNRQQWSWLRVLLWLVFFLLSAVHVRLVPFFALVAGPILAVSVQEWTAGREAARQKTAGASSGLRRLQVRQEVVGLIVVFGLLIAAWPGFLQAQQKQPPEPRGWDLLPDRSLDGTSRQLVQWRRQGLLGEARTLSYSPDIGNYLAWAGEPSIEKSFIDTRYSLFPVEVIRDYATLRQGIRHLAMSKEGQSPEEKQALLRHYGEAQALLRQYGIGQLVLSDADAVRLNQLVQALQEQPKAEWRLLFLEGRTAVLGWRDPEGKYDPDAIPMGCGLAALALADVRERLTDPFAGLRLDLDRLAYHPPESQQAPASGPARLARLSRWHDPFVRGRPTRSPELDEAVFYLSQWETERRKPSVAKIDAFRSALAAAVVGWPAPGAGSFTPPVTVGLIGMLAIKAEPPTVPQPAVEALKQVVIQGVNFQFEDGPDGLLWLALRAARRAIAADPDDAGGYLLLGEIYLRVLMHTRERMLAQQMPELNRVRRVQAAVALKEAERLDPLNPAVHDLLAQVFLLSNCMDLHVKHIKESLRLRRLAGKPAGLDAEAFTQQLLQQGAMVQLGDDALAAVESRVKSTLASRPKKLEQAMVLAQSGLGGQALVLLKVAGWAAIGNVGLEMAANLMMTVGEAREVQDLGYDFLKDSVQPYSFATIQMELAASLGDYSRAEQTLEPLQSLRPQFRAGLFTERALIGLGIGHQLLDPLVKPDLNLFLWARGQLDVIGRIGALQTQANLFVLQGVLTLEQGDAERAENLFLKGLATWGSPSAVSQGSGTDFGGRPLAQYYLERIRSASRGS